MRDEQVAGLFAIVMFLFFLMFMFAISPANAHEWYSPYCCSGKDCAPARVQINSDGSVTASNQFGTARFSRRQFRPSQDHQYHACIHPSLGPRCLYIPAGM